MPGQTSVQHSSSSSYSLVKRYLDDFLRTREPPKTFCPSEVARALTADDLADCGFGEWREAMPLVREVAWQSRQDGQCEVLQKGALVGDVPPEHVKGPIRIRRTEG